MGRTVARVALAVAALVLGACELRAEVNVAVDGDGSGTVEFVVALDDETATLRPDLLGELEVDHLVDAGWVVTGPVPVDGMQEVRASHDFDRPAEVGPLVEQIAGEEGPLRDVAVTTSSGFASESVRFEAIVDFGRLADSPLADDVADTDPEAAAVDDVIAALDERFGAAIDDIVDVRVAVRLPGDVTSNAPTQASNGAVWHPSVLERGALHLEATGTRSRPGRVAAVVAAVAGGVVVVLGGAVGVARWRRAGRR